MVATVAVFSVLLLEPSLGDAIRTFWNHTIRFQATRGSPFSLWDWGQYHARGLPDLHAVQVVLEVAVAAFAVVVAFLPGGSKTPLELAALTAALLLGTQLVLTHWFYLYLPWMLPFVLLAFFLPRGDAEAGLREPVGRRSGSLVVAGRRFRRRSAPGLPSVWQGRAQISDIPVYERYGDAIERGHVPYRDFRLEYPPGALAVFAVPSLVTDGPRSYARAFAIEMVLLGLAGARSVLRGAAALGAGGLRLAPGWRRSPLAPVLLGPLVLTRFDLYPAARDGGRRRPAPGRAATGSGPVSSALRSR